jgi:peptidoglycan/LPS O-acetylase OafA/YrhL
MIWMETRLIEMEEKRFVELDVLRGIAAMIVLFFHFTLFREEAKYGFQLGITGVDLFFMISGFVILMSLEKSKNANLFFLLRCIRLYPIYWIIATFTFLLFFGLNLFNGEIPYSEIPFKDYCVNLSMFQYYFNVPNIDGSYWTLIIEMLFYMSIYVLFRLKLLSKIIEIGLVFGAIMACYIFAIRHFNFPDYTRFYPFIYHFPMFYIGIIFYKMIELKQVPYYYYLLIVGSICIQLYLFEYGRAFHFISIIYYAIALVFFTGIFLLFSKNLLSGIVTKSTRFLGSISYPLYLIHQPLCYGIIIPYFTDVLKINFWISSLLIALPITLILATFFTFKVDMPIRRFLKQKVQLLLAK